MGLKEPLPDDTKGNLTKTKNNVNKKGQSGFNPGTKVESTTNSTKKLIFSFKKDSKGNTKLPANANNKNNVFVQHRRVQSHGQAQ